MNNITITTGYMGSGSSAITSLISEFNGYRSNNGDFEYILLHCPDGLFDLEDKLLLGNNVVRSDEAIHRFESCAKLLYDVKNFWPGMYKKRVSSNFMIITEKFLNKLVDFRHEKDVYWYYQQIPDNLILQLKNYSIRIFDALKRNKTNSSVLKYKEMKIAYPTPEKFYREAQTYLDDFYKLLGYENHNLLLDQFLLPHNLYRIDNYFGENTRIIVVERDPRDIFLLNKYVWLPNGCPVAYPINAKAFCDYYKKMRSSEKIIQDERIMRLCFEDLVYFYDDTVNKVREFLGLSIEDHVDVKKFFNPSVSINNTQLFNKKFGTKEEIELISKELEEFIYPFPYTIDDSSNEIF